MTAKILVEATASEGEHIHIDSQFTAIIAFLLAELGAKLCDRESRGGLDADGPPDGVWGMEEDLLSQHAPWAKTTLLRGTM